MYDTQAVQAMLRLNQCVRSTTCRQLVKASQVRTCTPKAIIYEIVPPLLTLTRAARTAELKRKYPSLQLVALYTKGITSYEILMQRGIKETGPAPDCENGKWKKLHYTIA